MRIGDTQYKSTPPVTDPLTGAVIPGYRDPADPCGYGLTQYQGECIPDSSPSLTMTGASGAAPGTSQQNYSVTARIIDYSALCKPGQTWDAVNQKCNDPMNWGMILGVLLVGFIVMKKSGGR